MAKPNIIFIMADDMGYGDFGVFNNGPAQTPALVIKKGKGNFIVNNIFEGSLEIAPGSAKLADNLKK